MIITIIISVLLLPSINNFCSEKKQSARSRQLVPSLMDICFERCKDDITDPVDKDLDISTIKKVFNGLASNAHREEMFTLLVEKKYPDVIETIATYRDQSIDETCSQKNHNNKSNKQHNMD